MQLSRLRLLIASVAAAALAAGCTDGPSAPSSSALLSDDRPNLLECPVNTTTSTTGIVGPLGGVLSLGNYVVNIPAGAVPVPTAFVLTVPEGRFMKVDVTAVGVEHYLFDAPVSVTVDYSRCSDGRVAGRDLSVWYVAPLTNAPLENMGGTDDRANRRITFSTGHLSGYVIAY